MESIKVGNHISKKSYSVRIGEILVSEGLISQTELYETLKKQKKLETYKPIGQLLIEKNIITQKQLEYILNSYGKRASLGQILVNSGIINEKLLQLALIEQKKTGNRLGDTLIKLKFISEEVMRQALCKQLNISYIDLYSVTIDRNLAKVINKNYAQKYQIVPVARIKESITLAMSDPTNLELIEELEAITGFSISVVTSTEAAIHDAFLRLYITIQDRELDSSIEIIEENQLEDSKPIQLNQEERKKADALVKQIISLAIDNSATDIHIESLDNKIEVRFRIDGVLQKLNLGNLQDQINKNGLGILSRIKILGRLNIVEKRRPQDGSFRAKIIKDSQMLNIDFRISIVPGYHGENVVLRILDSRKAPHSIEEVNLSEKITIGLHQILKKNNGIFLITGPTGSGKTTTLYGALGTLYQPGIKILTAEDPIEYIYTNITQCEVNQKIGNTFSNYIRSFLRQDPEIIMIGEIRDSETAEMAFRASQTGHLVLSTLHTNDAVSSITRLLGLDIEPNLISTCLLGILSQRLVRKICPKCKEEYIPSKALIKEFFETPPPDIPWYRGGKCSHCTYTGYSGRMAISELWIPNDNDIILINKGAPAHELKESSSESTIFMSESAMEKLYTGETNLEELVRTLPYATIYHFRINSKMFLEKMRCQTKAQG